MLKFNKRRVFALLALTSLIVGLLFVNMNVPTSAQPSDLLYLHGPSLKPIHMHSNITLTPIHMHHTKGILWPGEWPITQPNCTTDWYKIYPPAQDPPFELWHLSSWEDVGDPIGELSQNDQIDMTNMDTLEVEWFHVDRMTLTLNLSGPYPFPWHEPGETRMLLELKQPYCHPYDPYIVYAPVGTVWHEVWPVYSGIYSITMWNDDPNNPNGMLDFTDSISFDGGLNWWHVEDIATDLILRWKMLDPIGTYWHELYPDYCEWYEITSWSSFPDPYCDRISTKDTIDMLRLSSQTTHWYFVDRVTVTINVTDVQTNDWMMLDLKTTYFEEMYHAFKKPIGTLWHAVYPEEVYCTVFNLTIWDPMDPVWDNCNGVLDPCDHIILKNQTDGLDKMYHITDIAYDIILNEYITDPVGSRWHELYPACTANEYQIVDFSDNADLWLSPCDNVSLALLPTGLTEEYHVENVTLTLNVTILDIAGLSPFTVGQRVYLEHIQKPWNYTWPRLYHPKIEPWDTNWEVVCPTDNFGLTLTLDEWFDNCNGVIDFCDEITLYDASQALWVHVDEVAVDITVKKTAEPAHDVAVTYVRSVYDWVYQGSIDPINVTVVNEGDFTETVDVYAFYGGNLAAPKQTIVLTPGGSQSLVFNWDTTGVPPGFYTISANATIPIDDDPADNTLIGNVEEIRLLPWYKKPPYPDYARSGVPDFDQRQGWTYLWQDLGGRWSHCGPTAVANSLWWLDSEFEPNTVGPPAVIDNYRLVQSYGAWDDHDPTNMLPLVEHLAFLMDTDGRRTGIAKLGTDVVDMQAGITHYLSWSGVNPPGDVDGDGNVTMTDANIVTLAMGTVPGIPGWDLRADIFPVTTGYPPVADNIIDINDWNLVIANIGKNGTFYEHTTAAPTWDHIVEEVEKCQDVVLLIAPWYEDPPMWYRHDESAHFVTVAGLDPVTWEILLSDPINDNAEGGGPGHVPVPHPHAGPATHNNATLVSHDMYQVVLDPCPGGPLTILGYPGSIGGPLPGWKWQIEAAVITSPYEVENHDIAVTNLTSCYGSTILTQNFTYTVNTTVTNEGSFAETFMLTLYWNNTNVINSTMVSLAISETKVVQLDWNTTGLQRYANYTLRAHATPVPGETDTADNTFDDPRTLIMVYTGDINNDKKVDIKDIAAIAKLFGVNYPNPLYDPDKDLTCDGKIDIKDVALAAKEFGYVEP